MGDHPTFQSVQKLAKISKQSGIQQEVSFPHSFRMQGGQHTHKHTDIDYYRLKQPRGRSSGVQVSRQLNSYGHCNCLSTSVKGWKQQYGHNSWVIFIQEC